MGWLARAGPRRYESGSLPDPEGDPLANVLRRAAFGALSVVAAAAALVLDPATAAAQQEPAFLSFGVGAFDFHRDSREAQFELQYRHDRKLWVFNPIGGLAVTTDGAVYAYAGISLDIFFGNRVVLRPSFAPGLFGRGDGKDLGSTLEFRSSIELAYRFDDRSRLGVEIYHRSNASIGRRNPGEESLMLTYAIPTGKLFRW